MKVGRAVRQADGKKGKDDQNEISTQCLWWWWRILLTLYSSPAFSEVSQSVFRRRSVVSSGTHQSTTAGILAVGAVEAAVQCERAAAVHTMSLLKATVCHWMRSTAQMLFTTTNFNLSFTLISFRSSFILSLSLCVFDFSALIYLTHAYSTKERGKVMCVYELCLSLFSPVVFLNYHFLFNCRKK